MDCVNHSGVNATAIARIAARRSAQLRAGTRPGGQILCEDCMDSVAEHSAALCRAPRPSGPNPSAAAVLGLIPGVGAMYNGQFFKGFIHVVVFAVLISITDHYPIFGLFIAAWVLYQSFEAFHTARRCATASRCPIRLG